MYKEDNLKILITGASGLLGRELVNTISKEYDVEGWAFSRPDNLKRVDLLDFDNVKKAFMDFSPDILIHSAAERRPDVMNSNPDEAWKMNVDVTLNLALLCNTQKVHMAFISTDYVFDGTAPPYNEDSETSAINLYGKSKAESEKLIMNACKSFCIIRIPILYGPTANPDESAVTALLSKIKNSSEKNISINDGAVRYPTLTTDVSKAVNFLIKNSSKGIYHYTSEEPFTKYGMAVLIAEYMNINPEKIYPDIEPDKNAKRPLNAHLNNTKIRKLGFHFYTPFKKGLADVLKYL